MDDDNSVVTGSGGSPTLTMQILEGHGIGGSPVVKAAVGQRITLDIALQNTGEPLFWHLFTPNPIFYIKSRGKPIIYSGFQCVIILILFFLQPSTISMFTHATHMTEATHQTHLSTSSIQMGNWTQNTWNKVAIYAKHAHI